VVGPVDGVLVEAEPRPRGRARHAVTGAAARTTCIVRGMGEGRVRAGISLSF